MPAAGAGHSGALRRRASLLPPAATRSLRPRAPLKGAAPAPPRTQDAPRAGGARGRGGSAPGRLPASARLPQRSGLGGYESASRARPGGRTPPPRPRPPPVAGLPTARVLRTRRCRGTLRPQPRALHHPARPSDLTWPPPPTFCSNRRYLGSFYCNLGGGVGIFNMKPLHTKT